MNIVEYAIQMEKDGEVFYRKLQAKTRTPGLKAILGRLADAEAQHQAVLVRLAANRKAVLPKSRLRVQARNLFRKLLDKKPMAVDKLSQLKLYRQARSLEKKSIDFYTKKARKSDGEATTALFTAIIAEEKLHFALLDTLVNLLANAEGAWLENAEWFHQDEY
ncbi:MAG: hypothetical protein A2498_08195 [Lentisphaerae bacterium RIFOXYC12_FULL_60_16]|nr:MAG: hypothetical protein A2498_08195 [Lentisphaerae bacterium RIFOXYC12_FULL_60_16]OGV73733.1 MAG: hypothetical protein A2269_03870 [Lentisphaerae bacterium RIFOXYA12_FULL_60_10]OGV79737.1 MAG: hypothetical protein A2340_14765 [Lentisphaerae bacterium RIFOXYB12_FULL_60_10]